jgi:methylmalonyl-CoA mutase C-terminal domain/subunit
VASTALKITEEILLMDTDKRIRVLIAKPGLDGHDRGARVIAYGLRDAGYEVIYTGLRQTPEHIAREAAQEDVDLVGLSILSGAHLSLTRSVLERLKDQDAADIPVIIGGLIPDEDQAELDAMGVAGIFTAGTPIEKVAAAIEGLVGK